MWNSLAKGQALVVDSNLQWLTGSDATNIVLLLQKLGYEVTERHDLNAQVSQMQFVTYCQEMFVKFNTSTSASHCLLYSSSSRQVSEINNLCNFALDF